MSFLPSISSSRYLLSIRVLGRSDLIAREDRNLFQVFKSQKGLNHCDLELIFIDIPPTLPAIYTQ